MRANFGDQERQSNPLPSTGCIQYEPVFFTGLNSFLPPTKEHKVIYMGGTPSFYHHNRSPVREVKLRNYDRFRITHGQLGTWIWFSVAQSNTPLSLLGFLATLPLASLITAWGLPSNHYPVWVRCSLVLFKNSQCFRDSFSFCFHLSLNIFLK